MGIKSRWQYSSRMARDWFIKGRPFWITSSLAIITFLAIGAFPDHWLPRTAPIADRLRWIGMFYQFYGIAAVIIGLNGTAILFGQNGFFKSALAWLISGKNIFGRPKTVSLSARSLIAGVATATAVGTVVTRNRDTDTRLTELEQKITQLESSLRRSVEEARQYARQLIDEEAAARRIEQSEVHRQVRRALFEGVSLQAWGAVFLFLGVTLATIPDELARSFLYLQP